MLPALLAQIGLPFLVRAVGAGLEAIDHPIASGAAQALAAVDGAVNEGRISPDALSAANAATNAHLQRLAELDSADWQTGLKEVNASLRAEVASEDPYVRRMRPTFGYIMAITWCAQMGAVAWVIVRDPAAAGAVIAAMASLGTIWTVGLSVLGIYVYKRSEEKKAGLAESVGETGLLGSVLRRFTGATAR